MEKKITSYTSNEVGSGIYCECGQELTKFERDTLFNKGYKNKMCGKCESDYCHHAVTGE